jgi:predicted PolB exonuclease-like 3'-5' exonuclease
MYYKDRAFRPGVTIYTPDTQSVLNLFHVMGVKSTLYNLVRLDLGGHRNIVTIGEKLGRIIVTPVRTEHDDDLKVCYGYLFEFIDFFKGSKVYYSGDSRSIPPVILRMLRSDELDYIYQDTQSFSYNGYVHLPLEELSRLIPKSLRSKVWCMHIDESWDADAVKQLGFKTVKGFD